MAQTRAHCWNEKGRELQALGNADASWFGEALRRRSGLIVPRRRAQRLGLDADEYGVGLQRAGAT